MNKLQQLTQVTTIVADTGDIESIKKFSAMDATTNPSLIFKAAQDSRYRHLIEGAVRDSEAETHLLLDKLIVNFGVEILKIIPGRVSTEVDARLSFDTAGSIDKARTLIRLYENAGVSRERVLIKLASTWEGIRAAEVLENEGIHCNMTLLFSLAQAIACAEANVTLISPFVGRILDWYKKAENINSFQPHEDPGVLSATKIYSYYKKFGIQTQVMGASFRNKEQILELAGIDLLTISPQLMEELENATGDVPRKLDPETVRKADIDKIVMDEKAFRWMVNEDAMATEKLAEGIRLFTKDTLKLENLIASTTWS